MFLNDPTFQFSMGWLKETAPEKKAPISIADLTSQPPIGWLNDEAELNMRENEVTELTFHEPIDWLKGVKPNMKLISLTAPVLQLPIFELNADE